MKIYVGNNPTETHIIQQQLDAEGIQCEVRGEGVFGLRGEVPFDESSLPFIWLRDLTQESQAKAIINVLQQQADQHTGSSWICQACHEVNEAQFGSCWNCQHLAPST
ncbi:DUF2007 domain-containing protein [Vibrio methylphosphonaticus]|uniref:DUF2007 domain-containing protein n=1 Tax=Vibrio methylphosphonaticus TaxID=2946866 RepID=UPI00202A8800|nr:DUF2007 domain-containing protein [Vibrio methylphosphonaticus]MCL9774704.1 DUF2007 domain-containing protein [Vibrio methylphosphonaticus]